MANKTPSNYTTISFPITMSEKSRNSIRELRRIQSSVIRSSYNAFKRNLSQTEIQQLISNRFKSNLNSWLIQSGVSEGQTINSSSKSLNINKIIFGSKKLFNDLSLGKITKDVFKEARLAPLVIVGGANKKGNRLFTLDLKNNCIIFKESRNNHYKLFLPKLTKKNFRLLSELDLAMNSNKLPVTFKITDNSIKMSFDYNKLGFVFNNKIINPISTRVLGIDMNPNYIGLSILDFKDNKVIYTKMYDLSLLNIKSNLPSDDSKSIYINNKRSHEIYEITKDIAKISKHYRVSKVITEELSIGSKDHSKGTQFNRLVNNCWNRTKFITNLTKRILLLGIDIQDISPQYSSFIGNINYGKDNIIPDPIAASIELARRGYYKFTKDKSRLPISFNIEYLLNLWKKDVGIVVSEKKQLFINDILNRVKFTLLKNEWYELFNFVKRSRMRWRSSHNTMSFLDHYSIKSNVRFYQIKPMLYIYM